jgi:hypothetical protein
MGKSAKACRIPGQFGSHKKFAKNKYVAKQSGKKGMHKIPMVKKAVEKDIHKTKMAAKKAARKTAVGDAGDGSSRRIGSGMNKRASKEVQMN